MATLQLLVVLSLTVIFSFPQVIKGRSGVYFGRKFFNNKFDPNSISLEPKWPPKSTCELNHDFHVIHPLNYAAVQKSNQVAPPKAFRILANLPLFDGLSRALEIPAGFHRFQAVRG